jgi:Xaa-Pro aminopeptidase
MYKTPVCGIRIEDDVLITPTGYRILGPKIPETIVDLEKIIGTGLTITV